MIEDKRKINTCSVDLNKIFLSSNSYLIHYPYKITPGYEKSILQLNKKAKFLIR